MPISKIKIHPAIGIARLGNSPSEFFIGPELPGDHTPPAGGYRDLSNLIKRQGARFRLFAYDEQGNLIKEISSDDADISWNVHLVNSKAAAERFDGLNPNPPLRNANWTGDRNELVIDPGGASVSGPNQRTDCQFNGTLFGLPLSLELGTLRTDEKGRLIVLGGHGRSESPTNPPTPLNSPGSDFANHDFWFDDVSDGPVTATVNFRDGSPSVQVFGSWVIVAPPKFAPTLEHIISLYDTLYQVAVDKGVLSIPNPVSFNKHIFPILQRAVSMKWVYAPARHPFQANPGEPAIRSGVVDQLRVPAATPRQQGTGTGNMPKIWSDLYPGGVNGTLTRTQYAIMQAWASGAFINDWTGAPPAAATNVTPDGLDRAALDACIGGPFFPGIEASWKIRDVYRFVEPFRLDHTTLQPGDITKQMSLPWQSDFVDCAIESVDGSDEHDYLWWPAQRPINVLDSTNARVSWARDFSGGGGDLDASGMVSNWHRLGFLLPSGERLVETNRV